MLTRNPRDSKDISDNGKECGCLLGRTGNDQNVINVDCNSNPFRAPCKQQKALES